MQNDYHKETYSLILFIKRILSLLNYKYEFYMYAFAKCVVKTVE